jgi:hypothetical protein
MKPCLCCRPTMTHTTGLHRSRQQRAISLPERMMTVGQCLRIVNVRLGLTQLALVVFCRAGRFRVSFRCRFSTKMILRAPLEGHGMAVAPKTMAFTRVRVILRRFTLETAVSAYHPRPSQPLLTCFDFGQSPALAGLLQTGRTLTLRTIPSSYHQTAQPARLWRPGSGLPRRIFWDQVLRNCRTLDLRALPSSYLQTAQPARLWRLGSVLPRRVHWARVLPFRTLTLTLRILASSYRRTAQPARLWCLGSGLPRGVLWARVQRLWTTSAFRWIRQEMG